MRHQREELRRVEKQERLLRMRDRDNALVAGVLRGIMIKVELAVVKFVIHLLLKSLESTGVKLQGDHSR